VRRQLITEIVNIDRSRLAEDFGRQPFSLRHALTEHPLLSVESLAGLAGRLPEERVEHNYADLPTVVAPGEVKRAEMPPAEIARTIDTNGCWMVLKNIELDPDYKRLLDESLDQVAPLVSDREGGMTEREGFIFLSAPGSVTPSHTDPEHNFLLQVRGSKDMNVGRFPDRRTEQLALEDALGGGHRNIDWEPSDQRTFHLEPGDGVYVYPHAPHWVKNGESVSVSLSITFATLASEQARRVHSLNARLRRLGISPRPPGEKPRVDRRKAVCSRALGRLRRMA
jgi:cupin superfamily protein